VRTTVFALGVRPLFLGCHRLPDEIPYHAQLTEKDHSGSSGAYPILKHEGATLLRDGKPVGVLKRESDGISIHARWTGPKAELRATLGGAFAMETEGLCGRFAAPVEGPPMWQAMSDSEVAKQIKGTDHAFMLFLDAKLPENFDVIVDWGAVTGKLEVGKLVIAPGIKQTTVVTGGCDEPPVVRLNGREIGTLDRRMRGAIVTLEPGVCHAFQTVAYGDAKVAKPSEFFNEPVAALKEIPSYLLEGAPYSVKSYGGKGATNTQLVRVPCH
jgi:hypothetical protein